MTEGKGTKTADADYVKRTFLYILCGYALLIVLFYFLAGEQLHYRQSRGNIELPAADAGSVELSGGTSMEQHFTAEIDRIERISVQFGTYYRANAGTLTMELARPSDGAVLLHRTYDVSEIAEGQSLEMDAESPIENPDHETLMLRLTADSAQGLGVTPLLSFAAKAEGSVLLLNGESVDGMLCFSASGEDYIWTGRHYWKFAAAFGLLLLGLFCALERRFKKGKNSYVISALLAIRKYRFLIDQLVARDFKTRYKRSVLGMFWSFLNPLLMMLVQYFVFSTLFKSDIPNFAAYLIIGLVMFNFFSEASGQTLTSILGNASLITKVYMPKYIYPLTKTMLSVINLALSMVPLVLVCLLTGVRFQKSALLALYFFVCLIIFTLGIGMLLATSMVFFRDTLFLWGVFSMMWMYATPIFYPETILPDSFMGILKVNPLYYFVKNARICILNGISPEPIEYFRCLAIAMGTLLVGALVFHREQNKFMLYL